jgi:hypothetical protein
LEPNGEAEETTERTNTSEASHGPESWSTPILLSIHAACHWRQSKSERS